MTLRIQNFSRVAIGVVLGALLASVATAQIDMPVTRVSMETCMKAALSERDGAVRELELKIVNGVPIYEFFIENEGSAWEIECNAMTGRVMSITEDTEQDDDEVISEAFTESAEISGNEAKDIGLTAFPGELFGMENKLDANGGPYYELKIIGEDLHALEVKVDAISGRIIEVARAIYRVGE